MSLHCGRKLDNLEETHTDTGRTGVWDILQAEHLIKDGFYSQAVLIFSNGAQL